MENLVVQEANRFETNLYEYDDVYNACLEYFSGASLPASVAADKYLLRDEQNRYIELTPNDMHDRLSREFARIDSELYGLDFDERFKIYREAQNYFSRIVAQGSPMAAIANPFQLMSASNCVVIESPHDSIAGIMQAGTDLAQLCKRRAGVGLDTSTLRPEGMSVNNAAKTTSGCWSFSDFFSYVVRMIAQKGRRGALIITLDVHHPDVEKFARMKEDLTKVTGANVSIRLSDEFLQAVEDDTEYEQRWPCEGTPVMSRMVSARQVWETIKKNACENAEPGLIFWDKMVNRLPAHSYPQFKTCSTNPCLTEDTWIHTLSGPKQIKDLVGTKFAAFVDGSLHSSTAEGFFQTGTKQTYKLKTKNGYTLYCTDNHPLKKVTRKTRYKIYTDWVELKNLKIGDLICLQNQRRVSWDGEGTLDEGYILGSLLGDGTFGGYNKNKPYAKLCFWGETKHIMKEMVTTTIQSSVACRTDLGKSKPDFANAIKLDRVNVSSVGLKKLADRWGIQRYKFVKNDILEKASSDFYKGFISGYFDADGSIQGTQQKGVSARIGSNNLENLQMIQRMLSRLGIISTIYEDRKKAGYYPMPDGKGGSKDYYCKAMHDIVISNDNLILFRDLIGFRDPVKASTLVSKLEEYRRKPNRERFVDKIVEIKEAEVRPVYDCIIEGAHYFDANGISVHNCSEIGLSAYDSCRLISLNLTGYVQNAFSCDTQFDFDLYRTDVRTAIQMVDNLVDLELELVSKIKDVCDTAGEKELWQKLWQSGYDGRRTGLGTHGLADMLAQLNIRYDSDQALEFADQLYTVHRDTAYEASIDLAELRGAFPAFDWEVEKDNEYIRDLPEHLLERMAKVGRRNISILTQAPTGSVSLLSKCGRFDRHNISSGIEPVFRNNYTRRKKVNADDGNVRVDFVDPTGDSWQNFEVYHGNVLNYVEEVFELDLSDLELEETQKELAAARLHLPDSFVTSDEINWDYRVKLQGIIQDKIDHSISSTINLPKGTSADTVGDIYLQAWKAGLKGVTVYVDGSRSGVLLTGEDEKIDPKVRPDKVIRIMAPKRPKELPCDIHHHQVRGEKWTAIVGLLDGEPYEMFGGYSQLISLPKKYKKGVVRKRSKGKYRLILGEGDDELVINDVIGTFDTPELAWVTRLVSVSLRHATPIEFLVEQLGKEGKINSFNKVLARVLKKYIPDGEKVKSNETCEKCQSANLVWSEGCKKCLDCAETKCNV